MKQPFSGRVRFFLEHGAWPKPLTWEGVVAVLEAVSAEHGGRPIGSGGKPW